MTTLVTGGGGFLGGAIVRRLLARGDVVRSFSRNRYPELDALGVEQFTGDIADLSAVMRAVSGCDVVHHTAAKAGIAGRARDFVAANVTGTRNVIAACRRYGVGRLIFTSSPSVVAGRGDLKGVDESVPYPDRYLADYPRTKAGAEREVLAANCDGLLTVALRPHLIWGPGDHHLIPRLLDRAESGRLRLVGDGSNVIDVTYIEDAARAHVLAAEHLTPGSPVAGRAYFITGGEPIALVDFWNRVLAVHGLPPVTRQISPRLAYAIGTISEWLYALLPLRGEPPMTRFLAHQLSSHHWFDITAARRDFGYEPLVSISSGLAILERTAAAEATAVVKATGKRPRSGVLGAGMGNAHPSAD